MFGHDRVGKHSIRRVVMAKGGAETRSRLVCLISCRLVVSRRGPGGLVRIHVRIGRRAGHAELFIGPAAKIY